MKAERLSTMRLTQFIQENMDRILSQWDAFARTRTPAADSMDRRELRDAAEELLGSICQFIETGEEAAGDASVEGTSDAAESEIRESSREHASHRFGAGFTLDQMVSEYHALRQTVLRLWIEQSAKADQDELRDASRFSEALDKAQAESIRHYSDELEQARDLFLGALGHDLRSPLAAILLSSEFLLDRSELQQPQRATVEQIHRSTLRMHRMIDELRDFTRIRLGPGLPISPSRIDLLALCEETLQEIRASHPGREVELQHTGDLSVTWDGPRVAQMLSNLIENALYYSGRDSPVIVRLDTERDDRVLLAVQNEGPPISKALRESIFDPFVRVRKRRSQDSSPHSGLGLGLFIARQIAETHGGTLDVAGSEQGRTTFEARLPRQAQPSSIPSGLT